MFVDEALIEPLAVRATVLRGGLIAAKELVEIFDGDSRATSILAEADRASFASS